MEISNLLDGLMLGDGSLEKRKITHNPCLRVVRKLEDKEYLLWSANILKDFLSPSSISERVVRDKRTGKIYRSVLLRTKCSPFFSPLHERWYKNGTKTIPADLVLNKEILQVWFADDGCVSIEKGKLKRKCRFDIKLATHGFTEREVNYLREKLEHLFGFPFKVYKEKNKDQWTIRLLVKEHCKTFLRFIDAMFPLPRKSEKWRDPECFVFVDKPIPICIYCACDNIHRHGIINGSQYFHCLGCGRHFTEHSKPRKKYANATYEHVGEYWK